jgi:hypothetical protein
MVDQCSNPQCAKPLHYLREGRIFVFDVQDPVDGGKPIHRLEHYWLCGPCAQRFVLARKANEVQLLPKVTPRPVESLELPDVAPHRRPLAS